MRYGVSRHTLLITAGIIWLIAGINILQTGITYWFHTSHHWLFKTCEASLIFLFFFTLIFHKVYKKYTRRILQKQHRNCPFSFFDVKGWIMMGVMTGMGIGIRRLHLLPESFIAVFYTGLSLALIGTAIRFLLFWKKARTTSQIDQT